MNTRQRMGLVWLITSSFFLFTGISNGVVWMFIVFALFYFSGIVLFMLD